MNYYELSRTRLWFHGYNNRWGATTYLGLDTECIYLCLDKKNDSLVLGTKTIWFPWDVHIFKGFILFASSSGSGSGLS